MSKSRKTHDQKWAEGLRAYALMRVVTPTQPEVPSPEQVRDAKKRVRRYIETGQA